MIMYDPALTKPLSWNQNGWLIQTRIGLDKDAHWSCWSPEYHQRRPVERRRVWLNTLLGLLAIHLVIRNMPQKGSLDSIDQRRQIEDAERGLDRSTINRDRLEHSTTTLTTNTSPWMCQWPARINYMRWRCHSWNGIEGGSVAASILCTGWWWMSIPRLESMFP